LRAPWPLVGSPRFRAGRRPTTIWGLAAAAAALIVLVAPATSAAKRSCFGKRATKTGRGKIVGTSHKDVIVGLGGKTRSSGTAAPT
jgi:hypothetical protein